MKKLLIRISIALIILIIIGVIAVAVFMDSAIKRGVETVGPMLTKTEVGLESVSVSLLSGVGKIKGLLVGNPAGYKTPSSIHVGNVSLSLQPGSVFSDKVIIHSINVQAPEITFETDLKGNNLSKIISNLQSASGGGSNAKTDSKASKKLQVDDFLISAGKINISIVALGFAKSATLPLPDIHLTGLGQGPDGITAAELTERVIQAIEKEAVQISSAVFTDLSKDTANLTKGLGHDATGEADKISKGIGGLLKKN